MFLYLFVSLILRKKSTSFCILSVDYLHRVKIRIRGFEPLLPAPKAGVLPSYTIFWTP